MKNIKEQSLKVVKEYLDNYDGAPDAPLQTLETTLLSMIEEGKIDEKNYDGILDDLEARDRQCHKKQMSYFGHMDKFYLWEGEKL